jgi:sugar phosphate isomerase/epimerase
VPRPVLLFTGQWTDVPLEDLAPRLQEWGYGGVELACWGDHFDVARAVEEDDYCQAKLDLLARHDLQLLVLANHRLGQAVCDRVEPRHQRILPPRVWGDGDPAGVSERATAEMADTFRAARKLGVSVVTGFSGSSLWPGVLGYPAHTPEEIAEGYKDFADKWNPLLDVAAEAEVRFALEVHPGEIAYDLVTAERTLDALDGREDFGFNFDPSHLHWQGIDPCEFLRKFADRIFHVHIKDAAMNLNGRNGILGSQLMFGDPRRGWEFRGPGHGGIDWEALIRTLNSIGYNGPLSVEWSDAAIEREFGAQDACAFVKRLDFPPRQM